MKTRSLSKRVLSIVLGAQIVCALVLCCVALFHEQHTRLRAFDESLRGRSDSLLGAIQDAEDATDSVSIDPTELRLPRTDLYAVYSAGTSLVGSSQSAPPGLVAQREDGFRDVAIGRTTYRVYQRDAMRIIDRAENGGVGLKRPVTIVYASPESHLRHEVYEAAGYYVLLILFVVAITGISVLVLVSRALRPLGDFAEAAGQLSAPALVFDAPADVLAITELQPLAAALTRVVEGLRAAFDKEKRFLGDAAHELKTAVAVTRSTVQLLMLKPRSVEEHASGLVRVLDDVGRIESLVAQMLSSAGSDDSANGGERLDFALLVAATTSQMQSIAQASGIVLVLASCEGAFIRIRPERASALVSNLVLNAVQHSTAGMVVQIELSRASSKSIVLRVADTGRGIGPEALPHVFERFYREDRSRSRDTGGAGLGLSICKSIVEGAGGAIAIQSPFESGTTVTVTFSEA